MEESRRWIVLVGFVLLAIIVAGVAADELARLEEPDRADVAFLDQDGDVKGTVSVRVAVTWRERYVGLSNTDSLGPNEGMVFLHDEEGTYTYVMRDMAFPIDIVFIDASRTVTVIHHADVEEPPLTRYRGYGKWVVELPYSWTDRHGATVGDRVRFSWDGS